ncbi:MAG: ECF transporter S component [Aristaeellaceae bacterium]
MARKQLNNLVLLALFVGLIFLLGQTPLGLIPLGWCNVTLLVIPVAIGTIYMGLKSGLVLGLAFGATSMVSALIKPSVLVGTLMGASPLAVVVMTFLPRLCIPLVIWGVYKLLAKKQKHIAVAVAAACGSLTNTILYLGLMLIFYMMAGIDNTAVLTAIGATAGGAGPCEAIAAALICPPILTALWRIRRQA